MIYVDIGSNGSIRPSNATITFLITLEDAVVQWCRGWLARDRVVMMAKGYWIAHVKVTNPERYKDYVAANAKAFEKYGAKFLVRGGDCEVRNGEQPYDRHVVLEFDDYNKAKACYDSPEYQAAAVIRNEASEGYVVVVEGYDG